MQPLVKITEFLKVDGEIYAINYISHFSNELYFDEETFIQSIITYGLICLIYIVMINIVFNYFMYDNKGKENNSKSNDNIEEYSNGVSCVKIPKVFQLVAKEYFETETSMYLTFSGKLSLGRYLSKNVARVDKNNNYLTQKDPITKKKFRFIKYTIDDVDNMKKETKKWIIDNKSNWITYFAY